MKNCHRHGELTTAPIATLAPTSLAHILTCLAIAATPCPATSAETPVAPSPAASGATSAPKSDARGGSSDSSKEDPKCPDTAVVGQRIKEAAKLNAAEESVMGGGVASQAGEILSNLGGFGGIFGLAQTGASLSGHKKVADAIAADPCGEAVLADLPAAYQAAHRQFYKRDGKP